MAKTSYASVDDYIATQPAVVRPVLETVRRTIRKALPDAREIISYQIPAYRLPGGTALFFAGWKKHYSVYPAGAALVAAFRDELAPYEVNEKGTIRFPLSEPVPEKLIARIARYRAEEIEAASRAKSKAKAG